MHVSITSPTQREPAETSEEQEEASFQPAQGESSEMQGTVPHGSLAFYGFFYKTAAFTDFVFVNHKGTQGATAATACRPRGVEACS